MNGIKGVIEGGSQPSVACSLEELRSAPRYRTDFKAVLTSEQGERSRCCVSNLSLSGLQLELSVLAVQALMPASCAHDLHQPVHFQIDFQVPTSQCLDSPVTIDCMLIYCRRRTATGFVLGAKFAEFEDASDLLLQDYIENFGEPY